MSVDESSGWIGLPGALSIEACREICALAAVHCGFAAGSKPDVLVLGAGAGRAPIGLAVETARAGWAASVVAHTCFDGAIPSGPADAEALAANVERFGLTERIRIVRGGRGSGNEYQRARYDLIYITDAGGGYRALLADCLVALRSAKTRCIIAGDGTRDDGARLALREMFGERRVAAASDSWIVRIDPQSHPDARVLPP